MRVSAICYDPDVRLGLSLVGIETKEVHNNDELTRCFHQLVSDKDVGVILLDPQLSLYLDTLELDASNKMIVTI